MPKPASAILAYKNGWLLLVSLIRETKACWHVQPTQTKQTIRVSKNTGNAKVFSNGETVPEMLQWINERAAQQQGDQDGQRTL